MANDSTLAVRRALLTRLKAGADMIALVPAASIYPQSPPALPGFPFIRYGSPTAVPLRAACLDGSETTIAIHGFSKGRVIGQALVETAEDHAARIGTAIAHALDGAAINVSGVKLKVRWTGSTLLQDSAEAGCYHTVQNFRVRAFI